MSDNTKETEDVTPSAKSNELENAELSDQSDFSEPPDLDTTEDAETFPRAYVEELRNENAKYRQRALQADTLAQRLHTELVRATGRLADPTDLPFDPEHLADPQNLAGAIDELLVSKPHLATRRPFGDIGQGPTQSAATVDLAAILRNKAG